MKRGLRMKITVINGSDKHGVTWKMKEIFLEAFRNRAEITEFSLPKDGPGYCAGCTACFLRDENLCRDAETVRRIESAMLEADLLVFISPAYVFHTTGAMKALLDHFGYRWMPHRPAKAMFGKRAVILTQCLGAGAKSAEKDIRDSLSWWGISRIRACRFRLMQDIHWDRLAEKKRDAVTAALRKTAGKMLREDYSRPARTGLPARARFYAVRMIQKKVGKSGTESRDCDYWKENGWLGSDRPWKEPKA